MAAALKTYGLAYFVPGDSFLHRLDPRSKLFGLLIFLVAAFAAGSLVQLAILLIFLLLLFIVSRFSMTRVFRNMLIFAPLFIITFAIHFLGHPGQALFEIPILRLVATVEGLLAGVLFTLRMIGLILILGLFMALIAPQDLTDSLEKLARPLARLGLPVSQGALTISIALRFVPILAAEADRIRRAQASRGAPLEGVAIFRLHRLAPLLLPLFAGALKRADDLALALEARGYRGGVGRTQMQELRFRADDALAIFLSLVFCAGIWMLS
jgi:energy-coupling factor transport system permease protein